MSIEIMTSVRAVVFRTLGEAMRGGHHVGVGTVRLVWVPVPACRLDRPMGEVHIGGRRRETCMARLNGAPFWRDRTTFALVTDSPEVQAETAGQLVPAPRSSRAEAR